MPLTATKILDKLHTNPLSFLRHYRLMICGLGKISGVATFSFYDEEKTFNGFTTGRTSRKGVTKNRPCVMFNMVKKPPNARGNPNINNGFFNAHYVAMQRDNNNLTNSHHLVPGIGGPDIMLTSQLSGCSFGIGSQTHNGSRLMSHIQPNTKENFSRHHMHNTITSGLNNGSESIFERENQDNNSGYGNRDNSSTILGIRNGTTWNIYSQTYNIANSNLLQAQKLA